MVATPGLFVFFFRLSPVGVRSDRMSNRPLIVVAGFGLLVVAVVAIRLLIGPVGFEWPPDGIHWELRGQRVVAGTIVGVALAVAGVMLQSLLRNPLASPDLLGLAAGAGLAVMIAVLISSSGGGGQGRGGLLTAAIHAHSGAALLGSLAALGLVYMLSQRRGFVDPISLILVGVIITIICGALTQLVERLIPQHGGMAARHLLIGSLNDDETWLRLLVTGSIVLAGVVYAVVMSPAMDAAALSDDEARSVGVALGPLRIGLFIAAGVLTAVAVMLAGMIGFVGLVCPHVVRLLAGPSHRTVVIGAALAGAALVVGADAGVKMIHLDSGRIPIGVVTALIGGPMFIWLLRREQKG